jgi:predicted Zn-dependent protease
MVAAPACATDAQTYQVDSQKEATNPQTHPGQSGPASLGWGSNIENARIARAAELALREGQHAQAFDLAKRATQAAPNDPQLWFLLGYAARLNGNYAEAVDAYTRGLLLRPSAPDGLSGLAQVYSVMGQNENAKRLLRQVLAADPSRASDALLFGDISLRTKDFGSAIEFLTRAEKLEPGARSELLLALAYQQTGQADLANQYLEMAEHRDPGNPEVRRSMAGYDRESGKYAEAIATLKAIPHPAPDVIAELAYTYQLDGKVNEAASLYGQAANSRPKDMALQLSAAQAEVAIGAPDKARSFLERAASVDPQNYKLHAIEGQIARLDEHGADAVAEYNSAIAHLPANPVEGPLYGIQLHMDLSSLDRTLGREDAARHELEIAKTAIATIDASGQSQGGFFRLRALIKSDSGDLDGALEDIKSALALNRSDPAAMQLDGDILMKLGKTDDAIAVYRQILTTNPTNRFALISAGYASRAAGNHKDAIMYFERLARAEPSLYIPYLALGDLYTALHEYDKAETSYSAGYRLNSRDALIVAGGMNAAIEAHDLTTAKKWLDRVTTGMENEPQVLREEERYLSFAGQYQASAAVGRRAMAVLPRDRDVVVYLGYDLLHLGKYDDLLALTKKYRDILPQEPDIPLLQGYVHKHEGQSEEARLDFTEVLHRDPSVVTAYVNRGYMLNDLRQPAAAAADFEEALKREAGDGEAHLGLAYADLDLSKPQAALRQAEIAEKAMGDSRDIHVIRATAYGREDSLLKAANEYRAALNFTPNDSALHFGLGNSLFAQRHFREADDELEIADRLSPDNPKVEAVLARSYASLDERENTLHYVELAEQHAQSVSPLDRSQVFLFTGDALSTLGDEASAMLQYRKALEEPGSDRIAARLAIAQLMAQQGRFEDAKRQVALGWMEAAAGDATTPSGSEFIGAADVLRSAHEYELADTYLQRARSAGAADARVRIGLADNYLAVGDTARARAELAAVTAEGDDTTDYQYLIAEANVFQQEHQGAQALTSFGQAANAGGTDNDAEQSMLEAGAYEGLRVTPSLSLLSDFSVQPIFEDSTVYVLDSKLDATFAVPSTDASLLPPPRSSLQTEWTNAFHLHLGNVPTPAGFFQVRNAQGQISVPATNSIVSRNTTDYNFNIGLNPVARLGTNVAVFNLGVQETIRRDSISPVEMNQNLFRVFTYVSTNSFFNALSLSGYFIRETGPFTESNLHSTALTGALDFRVGTPWGKTALVTGWGSTDQQFSPIHYENYYTSSYIGLEHRFSERLNIRTVLEDLRAWRIVGANSGNAQNLRPAATVDFSPTRNWEIQATGAYSSTRSFHVYDAIQSGFSVSYAMPFQRKFEDRSGPLLLKYPIRFSAGLQQENFFNFSGGRNQQFRPYAQVSIF